MCGVLMVFPGWTPLFIALCNGNLPVVNHLVEHKADIDAKGESVSRGLHIGGPIARRSLPAGAARLPFHSIFHRQHPDIEKFPKNSQHPETPRSFSSAFLLRPETLPSERPNVYRLALGRRRRRIARKTRGGAARDPPLFWVGLDLFSECDRNAPMLN